VGEEEEKSMAGLPAVLVAALSVLFALLGEKTKPGMPMSALGFHVPGDGRRRQRSGLVPLSS
jgi:hypothetical protein